MAVTYGGNFENMSTPKKLANSFNMQLTRSKKPFKDNLVTAGRDFHPFQVPRQIGNRGQEGFEKD